MQEYRYIKEYAPFTQQTTLKLGEIYKIEPIDYINSHNFNFNIGNCIKYCSRAGLKGDAIEDLQKAIHYLQFEIERLKGLKNVEK